jgi:hypothetical protein
MRRRVAAVLAVAVLVGAASLAYANRTRTFDTELSVESAQVLSNGAIEVTGTAGSRSATCNSFRAVSLIDRRPGRRPRELAFGVAGYPAGAWLLRTKRDVGVRGALVVKVARSKIDITSITTDGTEETTRHRTVVCRGARDGIELP